MVIFQIIFALLIPLGILVYPMYAFCQVINSSILYLEDERHPDFNTDIEIYGLFILIHIKLCTIVWALSLTDLMPAYIFYLCLLILYIMSLPIVYYNINMMKKEYPEFIEN